MSRLPLAILSTCLGVMSASPVDTAQPGGASVTGTVVASASGEPIADATVTLYAATLPGNKLATQTDDKGAFVFTKLAAGRYRLGASKPGFLWANAGEPRVGAGGRAFVLRDGEQHDVRLRLPRPGVITGRVVDERGNPIVGASVQAWTSNLSGGYRRFESRGSATTDDRGVYRLHSLNPGRYAICASKRPFPPMLDEAQRLQREIDYLRRDVELTTGPRSDAARERLALLEPRLPAQIDPVRGFAPACQTDATGARSRISLGPDDERSGVDFRLSLTNLARIEGRVAGLALDPADTASIRLLNEDQELGDMFEMGRVFRDGRFLVRDVPPGRYAMLVTVDPRSPSGPYPQRAIAAQAIVVANDDLEGVVVEPPRRGTVEGQVVLRGRTDPPAGTVATVVVNLNPTTQTAVTRSVGPYTARLDATGRFVIENVLPGTYRVSAWTKGPPAPTWFTDAITLGGRDVAEDPIDIAPGQSVKDVVVTLTDRRASLAGTVLDETGEPAPEFLLLLYPTERRLWTVQARRMGVSRASPDGDYTITGLRPGTYRLATLRDVEFGAWFEPAFLEGLESTSIPVSIAGDGQTILNVRVKSSDR